MSATPPASLAPAERVLLFVYLYLGEHRHSPTWKCIAQGLGLTGNSSVPQHLRRLRTLGWVTWVPSEAQTIVLTKEGAQQARRLEAEVAQQGART